MKLDKKQGKVKKLSRSQKEAIGLLQIGTFLEYFDLMLYVHMAVLLNELFFPETDSRTASFIAAFTFCSTYIFRPFGALLFGWIGDNMGRKAAIIISTFMMALSCFFMTIIPTYEQVGLLASVMMIGCRVLQSLSATGEVIGAEIYLTETLDPPASYQAVSWIAEICTLGGVAALFITSVILECQVGWRAVFMLGGMIAFSGALARTKLRETSAFLKAKTQKSQGVLIEEVSVAKKTFWAYFFIYAGFPLCFYWVYIYGANILKHSMGYDIKQITHHNLVLTILSFVVGILLILMAKTIPPLKILRIRAIIFGVLVVISVPFVPFTTNIYALYTMLVLLTVSCLGTTPAISIFFQHFPVTKRFTYSSMLYAVTRALMYVVTSFGLLYLIDVFGSYGLWVIMLPMTFGFLWGVRHFEKLESLVASKKHSPFVNTLRIQAVS